MDKVVDVAAGMQRLVPAVVTQNTVRSTARSILRQGGGHNRGRAETGSKHPSCSKDNGGLADSVHQQGGRCASESREAYDTGASAKTNSGENDGPASSTGSGGTSCRDTVYSALRVLLKSNVLEHSYRRFRNEPSRLRKLWTRWCLETPRKSVHMLTWRRQRADHS